MTTDAQAQLDNAANPPEEAPPYVATWGSEVLGHGPRGQVVKVQVAFEDEPDHDHEARMRSEAQSVMKRQHGVWCTSVTYRKWPLTTS